MTLRSEGKKLYKGIELLCVGLITLSTNIHFFAIVKTQSICNKVMNLYSPYYKKQIGYLLRKTA